MERIETLTFLDEGEALVTFFDGRSFHLRVKETAFIRRTNADGKTADFSMKVCGVLTLQPTPEERRDPG